MEKTNRRHEDKLTQQLENPEWKLASRQFCGAINEQKLINTWLSA